VVKPLSDRFWAKVTKTDTCWLWTGAVTKAGYGRVMDSDGKVRGAHVVGYKLQVGPIPDGFVIDHKCHVKNCVRSDHIRAVTQKQNLENHSGARRDSQSGVRGVSWSEPYGKWVGYVSHHGRTIFVGRWSDLKEAEAAVVAKRQELFTHNDKDR
jgi:HNH endonuclease